MHPEHSWFGPTALDPTAESGEPAHEFSRLWQAFMRARLTLAAVLLALQTTLFFTGSAPGRIQLAISGAYLAGTVATRRYSRPGPLGTTFNRTWLGLVGLDVVAFSALQLYQGSGVNYTPLFVLPILLASVLGPLLLALGTAAGITVLLLLMTLWSFLQSASDAASQFVQPALSGVGYFAVAILANQLASRLVSEGRRARQSQLAARAQRQVNELVIESLPNGVLIVDEVGHVRAANPAARQLLGLAPVAQAGGFDLRDQTRWRPLLDLTRNSVGSGRSLEEDVTLGQDGLGPHRVHVRTRLAAPQDTSGESLCVLFLQDQREMEARMRTEKLASMGRMSTAVAHEVRNPLAAIVQANALLDEDLSDPRLKKFTAMISQNARRLGKIVDDVLNVTHIQPSEAGANAPALPLQETCARIGKDWAAQNRCEQRLSMMLTGAPLGVRFDSDHLRRVLVNLLDNALRHASARPDGIQMHTRSSGLRAEVSVWSDGAPMDQSVERHLFEPFFSSSSRSSGLGLYICRQLCDNHGATIAYHRGQRLRDGEPVEGNEFTVAFFPALPEQVSNQTNLNRDSSPWQTSPP